MGRMRWRWSAVLLVLASACGGGEPTVRGTHRARRTNTEASRSNGDRTDEARPPFAHRIDDAATWHRLAARPQTHAVARTEVVKFLISPTTGASG